MPNYVANVVTFGGDEKRIKDMLLAVQNDEFGTGSISFNKIIPMPPELDIECGRSKEIDFDESKAHKPDGLLKIVYVEPNRPPFVSEVGNDLKSLQRAVCGYIEPIYLGDGTILVGNEDAKFNGMEGNRSLGDSIIAGPFFIVGENGEDFRSLTDDEAQWYMDRFAEPEQISQQEVEGDMGFISCTY